jgi:hypothetical protein
MLQKSPRKRLYEKSAGNLANALDGSASLSCYNNVSTDFGDEFLDVLDVNDGAGGEERDESEEEEESPYWVKLHDTPGSYQCLIRDCKRILTSKGNVKRHIGNVHKFAMAAHQRAQTRIGAGGKEDEKWRKIGAGKWECTVCRTCLTTKQGAQKHVAARHPRELGGVEEEEEEEAKESEEESEFALIILSKFRMLICYLAS